MSAVILHVDVEPEGLSISFPVAHVEPTNLTQILFEPFLPGGGVMPDGTSRFTDESGKEIKRPGMPGVVFRSYAAKCIAPCLGRA